MLRLCSAAAVCVDAWAAADAAAVSASILIASVSAMLNCPGVGLDGGKKWLLPPGGSGEGERLRFPGVPLAMPTVGTWRAAV